ncbi:Dehydrogenase E1 component [Penicillium fimorum]|uniref:Dehydrogenase E1 component n=1 Tax=Penicillium fimorum TaxID=1882269 RepID=A0A9X0C8R6_9EURO|nr:Dehydrogenase E1 component [Penicillium fimorum]
MADTVRRIVLDKAGLELQIIGFGNKTTTKLNFVIHDTSSDIVAIADKFSQYEWVKKERYDTLRIRNEMKEVVRRGFELHRFELYRLGVEM